MRTSSIIATGLFCAFAGTGCALAGNPPAPAASVASPGAAKPAAPASPIVFADQSGHPLSPDAFTAAVKAGQRYTTKKDLDAGKFVLTLLPPGVNKPGAMSWEDLNRTAPSSATMVVDKAQYAVVFHDAAGKPVDLPAFVAGAEQGQQFVRNLDKQAHVATLTLLPIGAHERGSMPTSLFAGHGMSFAAIPAPGTVFPRLNLVKVGGGRIDTADLAGQPYVVDFFFADCIGCIEELPVLNAYHREYPGQQVFAVTYDNAEIAAHFVKQRGFDWPVAYDGHAFVDQLGIKVYPTLVVVGADGKVLATRLGANSTMTAASLDAWVTASLRGDHAPPAKP